MKVKRKHIGAMTAIAVATAAVAATAISLQPEITLSGGGNGHKPKIQRASDGTLVVAYGDSPAGAQDVYDTKADADRPARDIFVKYCTPSATVTCDNVGDWKVATTPAGAGNVSASATKSSMTSDWKGTLGDPAPYMGDTDKPNIKTSGPVMVLTWTSKYCPSGDLQAADTDGDVNTNQRAVRYLERSSRIIPFSCMWAAYSTNSGKNWSAPVQLSNGERDAKQDASFGTYVSTQYLTDGVTLNPDYKKAFLNFSWQEDPRGLQLGEADGPGDGASGANVSNGTDVWYTHAMVDTNTAPASFTWAGGPDAAAEPRAKGYRLTDNKTKMGIGGTDTAIPVFNATGTQVADKDIESGGTGAARPNIGMVGKNAIVAYEETKGSEGLDEGKFVRYHTFAYNTLPTDAAGKAGCIISDPKKNARRVRFLTQSPLEASNAAGQNVGINIAIFWKEGIYDKGGPSDIMVRRGMGGLAAAKMKPSVDANCAALTYEASQQLTNQLPAENISSRANRVTASDTGLTDGTETDFYENALAHRGVLRGGELWIGYNYTADLVKMWAQLDNYNFWLRKYSFDAESQTGSWALPFNVSKIDDKRINVREPRIFGTPASNTNPGFCDGTATQNTTFCQNRDVIYVMWGSQANVNPYDPEGGDDLGVYATVSLDAGNSFLPPVRYSEEMGSLFNDDESAFETQPVTRPDGTRFYGVFNTENATTETSAAAYRSGDIVNTPDGLPTIQVIVDTDGNDVPDLLVAFSYDAATDTISESSGTLPGFPMKGKTLTLTDVKVEYNGVVTDGLTYDFAPDTVSDGGGCSAATGERPVDPVLPLLAGLGLFGWALRRLRRS